VQLRAEKRQKREVVTTHGSENKPISEAWASNGMEVYIPCLLSGLGGANAAMTATFIYLHDDLGFLSAASAMFSLGAAFKVARRFSTQRRRAPLLSATQPTV
jgi:hypothetical protein